MKVTIVEVPEPMMRTFTMFEDINRQLLKETKKIRVSFHKHTKTRISTSMQIGDSYKNINIPVEGFKLHEESGWSYASGKKVTSHYFKKLKSQGYDKYKEYIKKLIPIVIKEYLKMDLEEVTVELEQCRW